MAKEKQSRVYTVEDINKLRRKDIITKNIKNHGSMKFLGFEDIFFILHNEDMFKDPLYKIDEYVWGLFKSYIEYAYERNQKL